MHGINVTFWRKLASTTNLAQMLWFNFCRDLPFVAIYTLFMRVCLSFCKYGQRSLSSFNVNIFLSLNGIGYYFAPNMIKNIHLHILYSLHSVHVFFFTVHIHSIFINQAILIHLVTYLKTFKDLGSGYSLSASINPVGGNIPPWNRDWCSHHFASFVAWD